MIINLRGWLRFIYVIVIFLFLSFMFYQIISWTLEVLNPKYNYKRPYGNSVEVISPIQNQKDHFTFKDRIYYFWYHGQ